MNLLDKVKVISSTRAPYRKESEGYIAWIHPFNPEELFGARIDVVFTKYGKAGKPRIEVLSIYANPFDIDSELIPSMKSCINDEALDSFLAISTRQSGYSSKTLLQRVEESRLKNLLEVPNFEFLAMLSAIACPLGSVYNIRPRLGIGNAAHEILRNDFHSHNLTQEMMVYLRDEIFLREPLRIPSFVSMCFVLDYRINKKIGIRVNTLLSGVDKNPEFRKVVLSRLRKTIANCGFAAIRGHEGRLLCMTEALRYLPITVSKKLDNEKKLEATKKATVGTKVEVDSQIDVAQDDSQEYRNPWKRTSAYDLRVDDSGTLRLNNNVITIPGNNVTISGAAYDTITIDGHFDSDLSEGDMRELSVNNEPSPIPRRAESVQLNPPGYLNHPGYYYPENLRQPTSIGNFVVSAFPTLLQILTRINEEAHDHYTHNELDIITLVNDEGRTVGVHCATENRRWRITYILQEREDEYSAALARTGQPREDGPIVYDYTSDAVPSIQGVCHKINALSRARGYGINDITHEIRQDPRNTHLFRTVDLQITLRYTMRVEEMGEDYVSTGAANNNNAE